jgi:hypothetical protein
MFPTLEASSQSDAHLAPAEQLSILTPSGLVVRLSSYVDYLLQSLHHSEAEHTVLRQLYSFIVGLPLRVCKTVLMKVERLLGVRQRPIIHAQRKRKNSGPDDNAERCPPEFDLSTSPSTRLRLSPRSPIKRAISEEDSDAMSDESYGPDKLLELDNSQYKSEDDPDYVPPEELIDSAEEESDRESEGEEIPEIGPQLSPCRDDHPLHQLQYDDGDVIPPSDFTMDKCETASPLKARENLIGDEQMSNEDDVNNLEKSADLNCNTENDHMNQENAQPVM